MSLISIGTASRISRRNNIGSGNAPAATLALVILMMLSAATTAATAATVRGRPSAELTADVGKVEQKRQLQLMDCGERCENFEIKVFKGYWLRTHPEKHFIDFLRDLVVYSAFYPELKHFKPLVDNAVQNYELCRYVTCSTDYMG